MKAKKPALGLNALIMAGGKAERMKFRNKPLLKFHGREMISHIIDALEKCSEIKKIHAAVRKDNRELIDFLKKRKAEIIFTSGKGYVEDLREIRSRAKLGKTIILPCDIPLVNEKIIKKLVKEYRMRKKPALAVYLPLKMFKKLGIEPAMVMGNLVPSGVNFADFDDLNAEEEKIAVSFKELAFNINTMKGLKAAESYITLKNINK